MVTRESPATFQQFSQESNQQSSQPSSQQRLSVQKLAQAGNSEAIAQWLNAHLLPQGLYAQVTVERPGELCVLVEFARFPSRDRLTQFICDRLGQLSLPLFSTLRFQGQFSDTDFLLWDEVMHWETGDRPIPAAPTPTQSASRVSFLVGGPKPPKPKQQPPKLPQFPPLSTLLPSSSTKFNKPLLIGSALTAFVVGVGYETVSRYALEPVTDLAYGISHWGDRSPKVQAALEPVAIWSPAIAPQVAQDTVTLMFSSDALLLEPNASGNSSEATLEPFLAADVTLMNLDQSQVAALAQDHKTDTSVWVESLTQSGVDVVNLAGAESLQEGRSGLNRTLQALETAGIGSVGAGRSARETRRPEILEVQGQRIAYLGYCDSDEDLQGGWGIRSNAALDQRIAEDIHAIRDQVDWVIVNYRWSGELAAYPADWQVRMARYAIDQGADLVVGHHPDILQGGEIYNGRAIAYSLGDFVFADSQAAQQNYDTAVLKVSLRDQQMRVEYLPVQVRDAKPAIVDNETGKTILNYLYQSSGLFEQPLESPTVLERRSPTIPDDPSNKPVTPVPPTEETTPFISNPSDGANPEALDITAKEEAESKVQAGGDSDPLVESWTETDFLEPTPVEQEVQELQGELPAADPEEFNTFTEDTVWIEDETDSTAIAPDVEADSGSDDFVY